MPSTEPTIDNETIARFRLRRHHLLDNVAADAVAIARDVCGIQAQVMSAAYLQLWARNHAITRSQIESALWKSRTLLKTSLMRQTLHLIPADEFLIYIAAQKPSRLAGALRIMAKFGIARAEADDLTALIMSALAAGPMSRAAIHAAVRPKVSKRVRAWMERVWSILRIPVAEGLICYGSGEGNQVNFIPTDRWLPKLKRTPISAKDAQCAIFRKYLKAYGPATFTDFSHWSGISMQEVRLLPPLVEGELVEVSVDKKICYLLRNDESELYKQLPCDPCIRLLPHFDTYLLAHRKKDHLLSAKHYKLVYRNQGWISPVVLIDGAIAGVWSYKTKGKKIQVAIEPFGRLSRATRDAIAREAEALGLFIGITVQLQFASGK
jgi:hypothetical protein